MFVCHGLKNLAGLHTVAPGEQEKMLFMCNSVSIDSLTVQQGWKITLTGSHINIIHIITYLYFRFLTINLLTFWHCVYFGFAPY